MHAWETIEHSLDFIEEHLSEEISTEEPAKATPQGCVCGASPQNSARILLRKLEIHEVFLRFRAACGHYFSGEIALAE